MKVFKKSVISAIFLASISMTSNAAHATNIEADPSGMRHCLMQNAAIGDDAFIYCNSQLMGFDLSGDIANAGLGDQLEDGKPNGIIAHAGLGDQLEDGKPN